MAKSTPINIPEEYHLYYIKPVLEALSELQKEIENRQDTAYAASDIAAVYIQAEHALRELNRVVKVVAAIGRKLQQEIVPELFKEGKTTSVTALGYCATISSVVRTSIRKEMKEPAFDWMRKEGHGDITKVEPTIHPQTLEAWGRQELEVGNEIPDELFSIYTYDTTSLTKAAKK